MQRRAAPRDDGAGVGISIPAMGLGRGRYPHGRGDSRRCGAAHQGGLGDCGSELDTTMIRVNSEGCRAISLRSAP